MTRDNNKGQGTGFVIGTILVLIGAVIGILVLLQTTLQVSDREALPATSEPVVNDVPVAAASETTVSIETTLPTAEAPATVATQSTGPIGTAPPVAEASATIAATATLPPETASEPAISPETPVISEDAPAAAEKTLEPTVIGPAEPEPHVETTSDAVTPIDTDTTAAAEAEPAAEPGFLFGPPSAAGIRAPRCRRFGAGRNCRTSNLSDVPPYITRAQRRAKLRPQCPRCPDIPMWRFSREHQRPVLYPRFEPSRPGQPRKYLGRFGRP